MRNLSILPALVLGACVIAKSPGAGESTADGATDSMTGNDPTGDPVCPPNPAYTCTAPYPGTFGPCGDGPLDENCCLPLVCQDDDDCAEGETCQPGQYNGFGCYDVDVDGEVACECSTNPGGVPDNVCTPGAPLADEWCVVFADETTCNGAPETEMQFCRWIELHTLTIDAANDACKLDGPLSKCLTFDVNPQDGCQSIPCSIAQLDMTTAIARDIGDDTFEVWGLTDVFCGGGTPVGDWIAADDASLAQCQVTCGDD